MNRTDEKWVQGYPILPSKATSRDERNRLHVEEGEIMRLVDENNPFHDNWHTRALAERIDRFRADNLHRGGETAGMADWLEKYRPGTYPHTKNK